MDKDVLKTHGVNFCISLVASVIAGIIAGVIVFHYQSAASTPRVHYKVVSLSEKTWELQIDNDGKVPDYNVRCYLHFASSVYRHTQTPGVWQWEGAALTTATALNGQRDVTLASDMVPPHGQLVIGFEFASPVDSAPQVKVVTAHGQAHAE